MADAMTPAQEAAAFWGSAQNLAYSMELRLSCALRALEYFGQRYIDEEEKDMSDNDLEIEEARKLLEDAGFQVIEPPAPTPEHTCAVCGKTDEENYDDGFGSLVDIRLVVSDGEEGWSDVTRFFCQQHMEEATPVLVALGLGSHHHGSTTFVESDPEKCGGYNVCKLYDAEDDREIY